MKYPLASSTWEDEELQAIQRVVQTGMFTMGEYVSSFERRFAEYVGSRHAVMVNSGSSANLLMVAALFFRKSDPLRRGDEVIVPAVSWPTTYYPLSQYGLRLKFVDVDLHTLNYDLEALSSAVSDRTRLIMAVNLLGNPNDFDAIRKIIRSRSVVLLEDNCESLGAIYDGKQAGTIGLMGSYSTFFSHHMSTMEGGLIVTDDEELHHILLCLRAHGWTRNLPKVNRITGEKSDDPFEESFKFVLPGYNVRPLEIEGAIGLEQLKRLPAFLDHRRKNAELFKELFGSDRRFITQREIGQSSWFGFSFVIRGDSLIERRALTRYLSDNLVECRPIVAGNFAKNEVVKYMDHTVHGSLKNAELIDLNGFFVGNHQYDLGAELRHLERVLGSFR